MPKISDEQRAAARQRLIDATIAVAERDGVDGLTTRAIVAEAGVSSGMFYGHFESKEALLEAVVEQKVEELTRLLAAELELGAPIAPVVQGLLRLLVARDLRSLSSFRDTPGAEEANRQINRRLVDAFTPIVQTAIGAGVLRDDVDVAATIEFIDILLDGLNRRRASDGFVTSDARVAGVVVDAVERFFLVPPGDQS